ncbi:hypothetical protein J2X65_003494 [Ancylobacter sp. 3268]|uniref:hypothetical protein n=1 Tax=Ancylobacter sp. 3268 TaxID=2817752 RepID=UPI00285F99CB|nr:hypothetical protein [Ancylobacter sp. 3268]MDR6954126.1 hypothetical protein [Ancylobacter sp. 3268]
MRKYYYAQVDGFIAGAMRKKGDPVGPLTEREAKYPELAGLLGQDPPVVGAVESPPKPEPDPAMLERKTR